MLEGKDTFERFSELYDLGKDLEADINSIGFTPKEIKNNSDLTTLKDAMQTGVTIS